jgi:hypothetical protein
MGYTHYWSFRSVKGETAKIEAVYQKTIKECQKIVLVYQKEFGHLQGYSAHTKLGQYGGINFNGSKDEAHETFVLREHFKENSDFNFCKTAQKPYDLAVVACLCILQHRLKDAIQVSSDGDYFDWQPGLEFAKKVLKLKRLNIPIDIRKREVI